MNELIPIGRFSALTGLSQKALRIYHDQGLLVPASVDATSGYRYYLGSQVSAATTIGLLRRAGVRLADIAAFLADPARSRVEEWREALDAEIADRRSLLEHVLDLIDHKEPTPMTTATSSAKLERAIPVLASVDLEATQRFYADRLGFQPVATYPDYAVASRDGIQIHFWLTDDKAFAENTSCRIDVSGIDGLYQEMVGAGVVHPNGQLRDQPWGMREFTVVDQDGNCVNFQERLSQ